MFRNNYTVYDKLLKSFPMQPRLINTLLSFQSLLQSHSLKFKWTAIINELVIKNNSNKE